MKAFPIVILIFLIFSPASSSSSEIKNIRVKRTVNTFLRYFGFKVIPIEDVEFVTERERIVESSTRNPKLRIQTRMPRLKVDDETEKNKMTEMTTAKTTTTMEENLYQKLPKHLVDAAALNLDAMIEALTIMKAPSANATLNSTFIINVPATMMTAEKLIEGSEDEIQIEMMQPPPVIMMMNNQNMSMMKMEMMQAPKMEVPSMDSIMMPEEMSKENVMNFPYPPPIELPQFPLPYPPTINFPPTPSFQPAPDFSTFTNANDNNYEILRSKEISLPPNEIIVGNTIMVSDFNSYPQNLFVPQVFTPQSYQSDNRYYYKK